MKISKEKLQALINFGFLILFPISVISGIIFKQLSSTGYVNNLRLITSFLGFGANGWEKIHTSFNYLLIFLVLAHLALNWDYAKKLPKVVRDIYQQDIRPKINWKKVFKRSRK